MNLLDKAKYELDLIGLKEDGDEFDVRMREHLLKMVEVFCLEGHSGASASYAIHTLENLLNHKPLSPLTGEDEEWDDVSKMSGYELYQNKRYSAVFKEGDGEAYDIAGKQFWKWEKDENGIPYKWYYTSSDSKVSVTFPYIVPNSPELIFVE